MKLSLALLALGAIAGGSSAFQAPSVLSAGKTFNNRIAVGGNTALMAATMDGTDVVNVVNGQKRKKTKQVSKSVYSWGECFSLFCYCLGRSLFGRLS